MTFTIPGEEPVGYTYRAENYPADKILDALFEAGLLLARPHFASPAVVEPAVTESTLRSMAEVQGIEYDDPRSYDSDVFPKPIYADQLSCSDSEWTELAPSHTFEFIPRNDGVPHCMFCGAEELPNHPESTEKEGE